MLFPRTLTLLLLSSLPGLAVTFHLDIVVASGDVVDGRTINALVGFDVSGNGRFAYGAQFDETGLPTGVIVEDTVVAASGAEIDGVVLSLAAIPQINDAGEIVFVGRDAATTQGTGLGVFTPTRAVALPGDVFDGGELTEMDMYPTINEAGRIAFGGVIGGRRVIRTEAMELVGDGAIVDGHQIRLPLPGPRTIEWNNNGNLLFGSVGSPFPDSAVGLFTLDGRRNDRGSSALDINDQGQFLASLFGTVDDPGMLLSDSGPVATAGDLLDGFLLAEFRDGALNERGDIAFISSRFDGQGFQSGVFTPSQKLLATGDALEGKTVDSVSQVSLSNAGEIYFQTFFEDGSTAIVKATPVPEPSTVVLFGLGLCVLEVFRRRARP